MAQGRAFRPSKTAWLDRNQIRERLEFKNLILVDDTGIEPVTGIPVSLFSKKSYLPQK